MKRENLTRQNFISVDNKTARNSYGTYFTIGDNVKHEDDKAGESNIIRFSIDSKSNEVLAFTEKGYVHIDFITLNHQ